MVSESLRRKLEIQGYTGVEEETLDETVNWLRLSPAFCLAGIVLGTALASPLILAAMTIFAIPGIFMNHTPPGYFYNFVLRRWTGTRPLPVNGAPRKFACLVAALWLSSTSYAFYAGLSNTGYALGIAMTFVAGLMTFRHYCIASVIYRKVFGWKPGER